jgi:hypothetical protein
MPLDMPGPRHYALLLAPPLLAAALAAHASPVPPASFVTADDGPPPPLPLASPITDHLSLSGGFYWGHIQTYGQFDTGKGAPGTPLSAEHDLGLTNEAYQPRFEIIFRLEQRSRLRVDFLDVRRNGENELDRTIQFGDQTFQPNVLLQSTIDWRQMDITYTYSLLRGERYELGAGLGLHLLEAEAIAQVPSTPQRVDYSEAAPFATVALDGTYLIGSRWSLNARGQYMHITVSNLSALLEDYRADAQYRWRRNFALGVSYEYERASVDIRNQDPSGIIRLAFTGPELFVRVSY